MKDVGAPVSCIGCGTTRVRVGTSPREGERIIHTETGWIRPDATGAVWFACDACFADGLSIAADADGTVVVFFPTGVAA